VLHAPKKEPALTHQEESAVLEAVTAILIEHGPAAMATADRQGYANGFKPKTLRTRAGEVHLRIPQTRDYHDDEGRPFYPKSLDQGGRSERAMTLAVAEMYDLKTAPDFAHRLEANIPEALTVFAFPTAHRRRLRTSNGLERLNKEIKRRTRVATLFPNEASVLRLVSAVLSEINDDWETDRSYLNMKAG